MKRLSIFLFSATLCLTIGAPATIFAASYTNSGTFMYTMGGNDPSNPKADLTEFSASVQEWLKDQGSARYEGMDLEFYAKVDGESGAREGNGYVEITYEDEKKGGDWITGDAVEFYSVKAGNNYALYYVDPDEPNGYSWSTEHLSVGKKGNNQPDISHFSTWRFVGGSGGGGINPVPEPGTFGLMGLGLAGWIGLRRRSKN